MAGAFLISAALAISMVGLLTFSKTSNQQAESLLSKSYLSRMAQEKFTRDLLGLNKNSDVTTFSTSPAHFPLGEAASFVRVVPSGVGNFNSSLYLVVIATLTKNNLPDPRHLRLETIFEFSAPPAPPPPVGKAESISDTVEGLLRGYMPADDPRFEAIKQQILAQLQEQWGMDLNLFSLEPTQYREPDMAADTLPSAKEPPGTFYLQPLSVNTPRSGGRVRMWKETTY